MRLKTQFIQMPLRFDADRLRAEVEAIEPDEWTPHPQGFAGNDALLLVTVGGQINHRTVGAMAPAPMLARCPYIRQVMGSFGTVIGRSRLMRLAGGSSVTEHADINYYWHDRVRVHVPIVTHPGVEFLCDGHSIHMPAGDAFIFDAWRLHDVINRDRAQRIHLVFDTVGSEQFWDLAEHGTEPHKHHAAGPVKAPTLVEYDADADPPLVFERHNAHAVMSPGEVDLLCRELIEQVDHEDSAGVGCADRFIAALNRHRHRWRATEAAQGNGAEAFPRYTRLIQQLSAQINGCERLRLTTNGMSASAVAQAWLIDPALNPHLLGEQHPDQPSPKAIRPEATTGAGSMPASAGSKPRALDRPVFIVGSPRSGSTLLFETLGSSDDLYSLGDEAHGIIESIAALHPATNGFASNRLKGRHATPDVSRQIRTRFIKGARDNQGRFFLQTPPSQRSPRIRFLEKTPKNALRIGFLQALFPDALFIHLTRDPRANIASIMDAWRSGRFVTYPNLPEPMDLPDCDTPGWSLLLPDGWRALRGRRLAEVAAFQWASAQRTILADLAGVPADRVCRVRYESFIEEPGAQAERLCGFIGVPFQGTIRRRVAQPLPPSRYTLSPPSPDKWRRHEREILPMLTGIADIVEQLGYAD